MIRNVLIGLFTLCSTQLSYGQKSAELGPTAGRAYYLGEINPETHVGRGVGSLSYGAVFRYNLNERWALKLNANRTRLSAEDEAMDLEFNQARLAEFETRLTEITANIEFNFLPYRIGIKERSFSPYLFTGFSYYWFNPSSNIGGIELEGDQRDQGERGNGLAFVFGPGIKTNIGRKFSLAFEWGFRKTSTDELDGLPNRFDELFELGKDYDNDWYVISGLMLTFKLTDEGPCPAMTNF